MWRTHFEELPFYLPDAECPSLFKDLCKANKSQRGRKRKDRKGHDDATLGLKCTKEKQWQWKTQNLSFLCLFFFVLFFGHTCASRAAHMAVGNKGSTVEHLWWRERTKKRERVATGGGGGWTMDGAAPHRRTALERTHHLCSFVELSHFNPPAKPFGNQLYGTERPPPLTLQSFSSVSVSISTPVLLRSAVRCPFTKTLPKPTGLPRVGWSGRAFSCCVRSMCLSFLLLMERITKQEK